MNPDNQHYNNNRNYYYPPSGSAHPPHQPASSPHHSMQHHQGGSFYSPNGSSDDISQLSQQMNHMNFTAPSHSHSGQPMLPYASSQSALPNPVPSGAGWSPNSFPSSMTPNVSLHSLLATPAPPPNRNPPASERNDANANLYIRNLPSFWNVRDLTDFYSHFGEVKSACVLTDPGTKKSKCVGFVRFATTLQAQTAVDSTNGIHVQGGGPIVARFAHVKSREEKSHERQIKKLQYEHMTTGAVPDHLPHELLEQVQKPIPHFKQTLTLDQQIPSTTQDATATVMAPSQFTQNQIFMLQQQQSPPPPHPRSLGPNPMLPPGQTPNSAQFSPQFGMVPQFNSNNGSANFSPTAQYAASGSPNLVGGPNQGLTSPQTTLLGQLSTPGSASSSQSLQRYQSGQPGQPIAGAPSGSQSQFTYNQQLLQLNQMHAGKGPQQLSPHGQPPTGLPGQLSTSSPLGSANLSSGPSTVTLLNVATPDISSMLNYALQHGVVKSIYIKTPPQAKKTQTQTQSNQSGSSDTPSNSSNNIVNSSSSSTNSSSSPLLINNSSVASTTANLSPSQLQHDRISSSNSSTSSSHHVATSPVNAVTLTAYITFFDQAAGYKFAAMLNQQVTSFSSGTIFTEMINEFSIPPEAVLSYSIASLSAGQQQQSPQPQPASSSSLQQQSQQTQPAAPTTTTQAQPSAQTQHSPQAQLSQ